jgi:hypothetical protein
MIGSFKLSLFETKAQFVAHRDSLANLQMQAMSTLQLHVCGGCGDEAGVFAEFNQKLLCSQCFRQAIESRVSVAS